jgi:hypothetical protein
MSFEEQIKDYSQRILTLKDNISTEEATKTSLIMPFFQILGYDVFNPAEFTPEFIADVGIKKGEKVDYAIMQNGNPVILIEAKSITQRLENHDSQLFRYFGTSNAKFAILTNGIVYKFFTDLDEQNKMDSKPFLELDMIDAKDSQVAELKKFHKSNFDLDSIKGTASDLKYLGLIRSAIRETFTALPDSFIRYILSYNVYEGRLTQNIMDKFTPLVKKGVTTYINELVNEKIQIALNTPEKIEPSLDVISEPDIMEKLDLIVTTEKEIEAYYIIKSLLVENIDMSRVGYKDTRSYFAVLVDQKVTRWICRVNFTDTQSYLVIRDSEDKDQRYEIKDLNEIYVLKDILIERLKTII